jgi:hypothetical protein
VSTRRRRMRVLGGGGGVVYLFDVTEFTQSLGAELVMDGGVENWSSVTNLTGWIETLAGTSTINQETDDVAAGSSSVRIDVDGSNSLAVLSQSLAVLATDLIEVSAVVKASGPGKLARVDVQPAASAAEVVALPTAYTKIKTIVKPSVNSTSIRYQNNNAASSSLYGDSFSARKITVNAIQSAAVDADIRVEFVLPETTYPGMRLLLAVRMPDAETNPLANGWVAMLRRNDLNTAWDCRLNVYVNGAMTNHVNQTSVGSPNALRVTTSGNDIAVYTGTGGVDGVFTQQGSTVTSAQFNTATRTLVVYDSEWTGAKRHRAQNFT